MIVKAYAAKEAKGEFERYEFELGEIAADEVDIAVGFRYLIRASPRFRMIEL